MCLSQDCRDMKGCLLLPLLLLGTVSALYLGECSPSLLKHLRHFFPASFWLLQVQGHRPLCSCPSPSLVRFLLDPELWPELSPRAPLQGKTLTCEEEGFSHLSLPNYPHVVSAGIRFSCICVCDARILAHPAPKGSFPSLVPDGVPRKTEWSHQSCPWSWRKVVPGLMVGYFFLQRRMPPIWAVRRHRQT